MTRINTITDSVRLEEFLVDPSGDPESILIRSQDEAVFSDSFAIALSELPSGHQRVIQLRYLTADFQTQAAVARHLGISAGRVGQIEAQAIRALRFKFARIGKYPSPTIYLRQRDAEIIDRAAWGWGPHVIADLVGISRDAAIKLVMQFEAMVTARRAEIVGRLALGRPHDARA